MNYKEMEKEDLRETALENIQDIQNILNTFFENIDMYADEVLEKIQELEYMVKEL